MPTQPPFTLTPRILNLVAECSERVALWRSGQEANVAPQLRKENRIRSIQASLAIENNNLSIDQVTCIIEGRPVIGLPREIQEVKNAIVPYDQRHHHDPCSIVHYELEFIHPFSDGNGRIGCLWQTLILSRGHQQLAYLPVETVIRENQADYYVALGDADQAANASLFIEFMLNSIIDTLKKSPSTDQVSDQVKAILQACQKLGEASTDQLLQALSLAQAHLSAELPQARSPRPSHRDDPAGLAP